MTKDEYLVQRYQILSDGSNIIPTVFPVSFIPIPKIEDFDGGMISRYFVKKINDFAIIEISSEQYSSISSSYYIIISISWKISGPRNNVYKEKNVLDVEGVEEYNKKQILDAEKKMTGIKNKLNNPLQFWRGY